MDGPEIIWGWFKWPLLIVAVWGLIDGLIWPCKDDDNEDSGDAFPM